ncbi:MAG: NAD(P)H-hydrate dehydratase [Elusimicrobiota bacterium]
MKINLINKKIVEKFIPKRSDKGNKNVFGKVLVVAGSYLMSGAAYLASKSAMRSGCGLIYGVCTDKIKSILSNLFPEGIYYSYGGGDYINDKTCQLIYNLHIQKKFDVLLIGPGLGTNPETLKTVVEILKKLKIPSVIDADAITAISKYGTDFLKDIPSVITPHPGEARRLSQKDGVYLALDIAHKTGGVVVLKDYKTFITDGEHIFLNNRENSGLSKAGSGDVLCGIIAGFISQFKPYGITKDSLLKSAVAGVWVHSESGYKASKKFSKYSVLASDIIDMIGPVIKSL